MNVSDSDSSIIEKFVDHSIPPEMTWMFIPEKNKIYKFGRVIHQIIIKFMTLTVHQYICVQSIDDGIHFLQ